MQCDAAVNGEETAVFAMLYFACQRFLPDVGCRLFVCEFFLVRGMTV
jgi:hypothetical protein